MDKTNQKNVERNYGIDLLRIIAMFLVVVLHCQGHGGLLNNVESGSIQYYFVWIIEILAYIAVDVFGLISGYVGYNNKTKYSKFIYLWFEAVFYGLVITTIFKFIVPDEVYKSNFINSVLPISSRTWWYFTAYAGLVLVMPLLNKMINSCSEKTLRKMFVAMILVFSIYNIFTCKFSFVDGYSCVWLVYLYILGAIIHKCNVLKNIKYYQIFLIVIVLSAIAFLFKVFGFSYTNKIVTINKDLFINYTSPTVLITAILVLIGYSKLKINSRFYKYITFGASSSFAIYLINSQTLYNTKVLTNSFEYLKTSNILRIGLYIFIFSIGFVIGAILIDKIRILLFKLLCIDKLSKKIEGLINKVFTKLSNCL